jgi:hypothetical protein
MQEGEEKGYDKMKKIKVYVDTSVISAYFDEFNFTPF